MKAARLSLKSCIGTRLRKGLRPRGRRKVLPWAALLRVTRPWATAVGTALLGCMWSMIRRFGPCERMSPILKTPKIPSMPTL